MTSFGMDTAGLDSIARAVTSLSAGLGALSRLPVPPTGSSPLDTRLSELDRSLDEALAGLGRALLTHAMNASAAGLWYRRIERALADSQ